jgi:hypothetical protein
MKFRATCLSGAIALALLSPAHAAEPLAADATRKLQALGTKAFLIQWKGRVVGVEERGVTAISDGNTTLTVRENALAYIVHDKRATGTTDPVGYKGNDEAMRATGLKLLAAAGVDRKQVAEVRVLQQYTQTATHDPKRGATKVNAPQKSRRTLLVTRVVDEVPVISSRMTLDLDRNGRIALMELSWPEIPAKVREEAQSLRAVLRKDYAPPAVEGARLESREVVIVHSPGASFYNDVRAAIRVIYKPEKAEIGKRAVRYLDGAGRDIELPRQVDALKEERLTRPKAPA